MGGRVRWMSKGQVVVSDTSVEDITGKGKGKEVSNGDLQRRD